MLIDRRSFVAHAMSAGLAFTFTKGAFAAAPLSGTQSPGFYRYKLGSLEITAVLDGYVPMNADVFSGTSKGEIETILKNAGLTKALPTSVNAFVINSGERTYLVDTGTGSNRAYGTSLGKVKDNLNAAGILPEQIDAVIITHMHPDHADGLISADGAALYPNAELVIHEKEAGFWLDDGISSRSPDAMKPLFEGARTALKPYSSRMRRAADGEIFSGIQLSASPGHTPGHSVVEVSSGAQTLLLMADTLHNTHIHTAKPDTAFAFDMDPAQAASSRRRIFDRVAADGMLTAAAHVTFPSFGRIFVEGDHYRFAPADYVYTL